MTKYLVYKITNNINNKIYIGVHQTKDVNDDYMGSGKVLKRAINKYGVKYFIKEILYECETQEEMLQRETDIVNKEFVRRKDTYNINLGGYGGFYCLNDGSKEHIERCTKGGKRGGKTSGKIHAEKLKNDKKYLKEFSEKSSFSMKDKKWFDKSWLEFQRL